MLLGTKIRSLRDEQGILQRQVAASIFFTHSKEILKKNINFAKDIEDC